MPDTSKPHTPFPDFRSREFLLDHALRTMTFYHPHCMDPAGGFYHFYKDNGTVYDRRTRHLVSSTRFVFTYAMAYKHFGLDEYRGGVRHGIAAVLPQMMAQRSGHIINVASAAAQRVDAQAAVCCANKHAVRALSEELRQDSRDLRVTVVSPGPPRTDISDPTDNPQQKAAAGGSPERLSISASTIAEAIGYAIAQPAGIDVNELVIRPIRQLA